MKSKKEELEQKLAEVKQKLINNSFDLSGDYFENGDVSIFLARDIEEKRALLQEQKSLQAELMQLTVTASPNKMNTAHMFASKTVAIEPTTQVKQPSPKHTI